MRLDNYIAVDNTVRVVDSLIYKPDLKQLGFNRQELSDTGYQPVAAMLNIFYYYLNRIQEKRQSLGSLRYACH